MWRPTIRRQLLLRLTVDREPKIDYLNLSTLANQHILQLQIPMHNGPLMHVRHSFHYLLEYGPHQSLRQPRLPRLPRPLDQMVQTLPLAELHHKVHIRPRIDHLMQCHDIWVVRQRGEDADLTFEWGGRFGVAQMLLVVDLKCDGVPWLLVNGTLDGGEGALTDLELEGEVLEGEDLLL